MLLLSVSQCLTVDTTSRGSGLWRTALS